MKHVVAEPVVEDVDAQDEAKRGKEAGASQAAKKEDPKKQAPTTEARGSNQDEPQQKTAKADDPKGKPAPSKAATSTAPEASEQAIPKKEPPAKAENGNPRSEQILSQGADQKLKGEKVVKEKAKQESGSLRS